MENIIEIEHLHKRFGEVKAVQDLSFRVKEGELFAFLGVNGAGKSTTISILCGQLSKDSGNVCICGKSTDGNMDSIKRELGVVFQNSVLDKPLTVRDNLQSRAALYGIAGKKFEQRLSELAKLLDFEDLLWRTVGKLSGGQHRRIDIARALLHRPKILILDEPTTGLDPQTRKLLWDVVSDLRKKEHMTVFLTTHYMEEAADADYVVILDSGKIAAEGTPLTLKNTYTGDFITLYGVAEDVVKAFGLPYEAIRDAYRISVPNTAKATELIALTRRNCKLFFKDKWMFFTSLITPVILLVLYVTFLGKIYNNAFASAMPEGFGVDDTLISGVVGGQLISSILAVSCVTVAFCSNLLMVNDKITGARHDLTITPVKSSALALSYFFATFAATLIICLTALAVCLVYLVLVGWYLSLSDVLLLLLDVVLLVLFGTALSSLINVSLFTSGQGSAIGTIVSAGYGFLCGAYMPISNFGEGLQKVLSFLPGTYGTSLLRNHAMAGAYREMAAQNYPAEVVEAMKDSVDCNLYFFGDKVEIGTMYIVLGGSVLLLIGLYVLYNCLKARADA